MKRRDFVKAMVTASVSAKAMLGQEAAPQKPVSPAAEAAQAPVAPAPVPWMRGLTEIKPLPMQPLAPDAVAETNASFFTDRQLATLHRLSAVLVPAYQGYPGAVEAEAPKFLDFLIGVSPAERQRMYQSGLDRLEAESRQRFSIGFAETSDQQADELIRPWLRTWMTDHLPSEPYAHFINAAHTDIREATTNSQAWSDVVRAKGDKPRVDLYWYPVDPDLHRDGFAPLHRPTPNRRPA